MASPLLGIDHHLSGPSADVLSLKNPVTGWTWASVVAAGCAGPAGHSNPWQQEPCVHVKQQHQGINGLCLHHASTVRLLDMSQSNISGLPVNKWHPARTSRRLLGPCCKTGSKTTLSRHSAEQWCQSQLEQAGVSDHQAGLWTGPQAQTKQSTPISCIATVPF